MQLGNVMEKDTAKKHEGGEDKVFENIRTALAICESEALKLSPDKSQKCIELLFSTAMKTIRAIEAIKKRRELVVEK